MDWLVENFTLRQPNLYLKSLLYFMGPFGSLLWALNTLQYYKRDKLILNQQICRGIDKFVHLTWAVFCIVQVLLWVSGKATLKAVLPKLWEPWIAGVGAELELQEVTVEGGDLFRVQLHSDATNGFMLIPLHHLNAVCPAVTAENNKLKSDSVVDPLLIPSPVWRVSD